MFQRKKAKKRKRPNEFLKANQVKTRPVKVQMKLFRPTNLRWGQIFEIWPKEGQLGNPVPQYTHPLTLKIYAYGYSYREWK